MKIHAKDYCSVGQPESEAAGALFDAIEDKEKVTVVLDDGLVYTKRFLREAFLYYQGELTVIGSPEAQATVEGFKFIRNCDKLIGKIRNSYLKNGKVHFWPMEFPDISELMSFKEYTGALMYLMSQGCLWCLVDFSDGRRCVINDREELTQVLGGPNGIGSDTSQSVRLHFYITEEWGKSLCHMTPMKKEEVVVRKQEWNYKEWIITFVAFFMASLLVQLMLTFAGLQ